MKTIAADYKSDPSRISKWLRQVYDDIFEFNYNNRTLFQKEGIKATLHFRNYDSVEIFYTSLPVLPRVHETFIYHFVNAKVGTNYFWVDKIEHQFENNKMETTVSLEGGFVNKYREFLLDRALFEEYLTLHDIFTKNDFEIERELKRLYRR